MCAAFASPFVLADGGKVVVKLTGHSTCSLFFFFSFSSLSTLVIWLCPTNCDLPSHFEGFSSLLIDLFGAQAVCRFVRLFSKTEHNQAVKRNCTAVIAMCSDYYWPILLGVLCFANQMVIGALTRKKVCRIECDNYWAEFINSLALVAAAALTASFTASWYTRCTLTSTESDAISILSLVLESLVTISCISHRLPSKPLLAVMAVQFSSS